MSDLSAVKAFIATYTGLKAGAPITVNEGGISPTWYSIVPAAGTDVLEEDVAGHRVRQFPFMFQSTRYTVDEAERLESIGFYDGFSDWLRTKTNANQLPTLASGKTATLIETTGRAFLLQYAPDVGVYTIPCRLEYQQDS